MKNYRYVLKFKDTHVGRKIKNCLDYAWRYTPSKNNFMNYSVFVLGPNEHERKQLIYDKCLRQQSTANGNPISTIDDLRKYEKKLEESDKIPFFASIKSAPYVLIYTHRVADKINSYQQENMDNGNVYEQTFPQGTDKYHAASLLSRIEIGMFAANFSNKCFENQIDVSFILCMPTELEAWTEPEWDFITDSPVLIQLAGRGESFRRDFIDENTDLKPNFGEIVKFL